MADLMEVRDINHIPGANLRLADSVRSSKQLRGARLELACANVKGAPGRLGWREVQAEALQRAELPPQQ